MKKYITCVLAFLFLCVPAHAGYQTRPESTDKQYTDSAIADLGLTDGTGELVPASVASVGKVGGSFFATDDSYIYPSLSLGDGFFIWQGKAYARVGTTATDWQGDTVQTIAYDVEMDSVTGFVDDATFDDAWDTANLSDSWTLDKWYYASSNPPTRTMKTFGGKRALSFARSGTTNFTVDTLQTALTAGAGHTHYVAGWIYCPATGQTGTTGDLAPVAMMGISETGNIANPDWALVGAKYDGAGAATYYTFFTVAGGSVAVDTTSVPLGQWAYIILSATSTTATLKIYGADSTSDTETGTITDIDAGWDNIYAAVMTRSQMGGTSTGTSTIYVNSIVAWTEE